MNNYETFLTETYVGEKKLLGICFQLSTYTPKAQEFRDDLIRVNKN